LNDLTPRQESSAAPRLRLAALIAAELLFLLIVRWVLVAPSALRIVVGMILALPFVVGAPLIYVGHRRSYAWLTLALAPSMVLGLTEAVANVAMRTWATLLLLDVFVTFLLLVAYLRVTHSSSQL